MYSDRERKHVLRIYEIYIMKSTKDLSNHPFCRTLGADDHFPLIQITNTWRTITLCKLYMIRTVKMIITGQCHWMDKWTVKARLSQKKVSMNR